MNKVLQSKLMELFILKDYVAYNKYLPVNPRRQALLDYQNSPTVQQRVNGVVGDVLEVMERHGGLYSEKD